jgi:hypothetical protein
MKIYNGDVHMKKHLVMFLLVFALFTTGVAQAVDLQAAQKIEDVVAKCVAEVRSLLLPFGAEAGFPDVSPEGLTDASYQQLYRAAASRAQKGSQIMADFISANKLPYRVEFSARYFMKRLEIASHEYDGMTGNEKVFEHLCREFAAACDRGFQELRLWSVPEMLAFDNIWFKNIQASFIPVKAKMQLAVVPAGIDPSQAKKFWKEAATALVEAGNEAGIASTKVGAGGLIGMPAWRLRLAIKYFKAAAKAAVIDMWHVNENNPKIWVTACKKLRREIEIINGEISNFLALHGGNPEEVKPVLYMMSAATAINMADAGEEIEIKASASDKGMTVETGINSLTIYGIADGPEPAYDIMGMPVGDYARSVRFTLDIDKAPTTDAFGNTNYTKKNRRIFTVMTSKGATAEQVAVALAKKVNDARDFRAKASAESPEQARIDFSHR